MISNGSRTGYCTHLSLYLSSRLLRYWNGKRKKTLFKYLVSFYSLDKRAMNSNAMFYLMNLFAVHLLWFSYVLLDLLLPRDEWMCLLPAHVCRLPFWSYAKLLFNCWLVLPKFNGAAHVYEHFVRPMIVNQQVVNIWYIPKKGESERPDDVISAAQRYIEQNGSKAFENLVNKVLSISW